MTDNNLISNQQLQQYHQQGYFTVEGLFTADEVEAVRNEITNTVARYPDVPKGLIEIEPSVANGENTPELLELGVRKLANVARHNAFFHNLAFHPKMVEIATKLLGPDVKLLQSILFVEAGALRRRKDMAPGQRIFSAGAKPYYRLLGRL